MKRKISSPVVQVIIDDDQRILMDRPDAKRFDFSKIYVNSDGYVSCGTGKNKKLLHRIIMQPPENMLVDHRNHDPRDNRKSNLRICTASQNQMNSKIRKDNKSGFRGVSFSNKYKKYRAKITVNGKPVASVFLTPPKKLHKPMMKQQLFCMVSSMQGKGVDRGR